MKIYLTDENGNRPHYDTPDEYREAIDAAEDFIIERMGEKDALAAISKALSYDTKEDIYEYIIRVYDLNDEDEA